VLCLEASATDLAAAGPKARPLVRNIRPSRKTQVRSAPRAACARTQLSDIAASIATRGRTYTKWRTRRRGFSSSRARAPGPAAVSAAADSAYARDGRRDRTAAPTSGPASARRRSQTAPSPATKRSPYRVPEQGAASARLLNGESVSAPSPPRRAGAHRRTTTEPYSLLPGGSSSQICGRSTPDDADPEPRRFERLHTGQAQYSSSSLIGKNGRRQRLGVPLHSAPATASGSPPGERVSSPILPRRYVAPRLAPDLPRDRKTRAQATLQAGRGGGESRRRRPGRRPSKACIAHLTSKGRGKADAGPGDR
jgi:hypothetical protein